MSPEPSSSPPITFTLFAFLALGDARTTREGRGLSIIGAIAAVGALRGAHFALTSASGTSDVALGLLWGLSLGAIGWGAFVVASDRRVALPSVVALALDAASERVGAIGGRIADRLGLGGERREDAS